MSSNMVYSSRKIQRDNPNIDSNPGSIAGRISVKDMGTRVEHEKAENEITKRRASSLEKTYESSSSTKMGKGEDHLYELLMTDIHKYLPDASHEVLVSATASAIDILRSDSLSHREKLDELNDLLSIQLDEIEFNDLFVLAKKLSISNTESNDQIQDQNNDGIAIIIDDEEEEEDQISEEEIEEAEIPHRILDDREGYNDFESDAVVIKENASDEKSEAKSEISLPKRVDVLYIQRKLKEYLGDIDPSVIQDKRERLINFIQNKEISTRELENNIMELMEFDHFEFVKLLMSNRWKVAFGLKLSQGENEENRDEVISDMRAMGLESLISEMFPEVSDQNTKNKRRKSIDDETNDLKRIKDNKQKREPKIVDLEALSFEKGSNLMTVSKVSLPEGSYQQNKKLYDIVTIPAPAPPPSLEEMKESLVSIASLPKWAQSVFPTNETKVLNRIQSKVFPCAFNSDENLLLCAPTGAGKTNVAMLAALRTLSNNLNHNTGEINLKDFKIVYIAPLKALVQEQVREFERRLTPNFGIVVNELTGDSNLSKQQIMETHVIVTTPEKWDVITRKGDEKEYLSLVQLVIIDEIHLLHDNRGPVLESIISRSLREGNLDSNYTRLVGLSATLPNYADVAMFLHVNPKSGLFYFDASYRPCPLEQQFIGIKDRSPIKRINAMNEACLEKVTECRENGHQVIVFVHSRNDTHRTAKWLFQKLDSENKSDLMIDKKSPSNEILQQESEVMTDVNLRSLLITGFGIHHAGLKKEERAIVEDLFAQGHLKVLVSTATLAWGVNLPAHTVIIKGTDTYNPEKSEWMQLSPQDILQMLGRAGRPRYDKKGEGVIITTQDEVQYYLAILNQQLPIESQFISKIVDNLNAEVVLGTVKSRNDAVEWLGYTYLYIRMLQSPRIYHVGAEYEHDKDLVLKRTDLVHSALSILHEHNLVVYDSSSGSVKATELGKIASHFYISYNTISSFSKQLRPWSSEIDILRTFATSDEFRYITVRREEKAEMAKLIERCPYPIKEGPLDALAKVNVLFQTYISKLKLEGFALMADMIYITQSAGRLFRAIHEIALRKNWSSLARISLEFCKMIERRMWLTDTPFRQFGSLAPTNVIKGSESSHLPWISYFHLSEAELAEAINFKGGSNIAYNLLQQFPRLQVGSYIQPISYDLLRVQIEFVPDWKWNKDVHRFFEHYLLLVEDEQGEKILHWDNVAISRDSIGKENYIEFTVPINEPLDPVYFVSFISERWLHSEIRVPVLTNNLIIPKPPHRFTSLLDLQLVSTSGLQSDDFIRTFDFKFFNKFQSQVFQTLYNTNENIFIGLSKGSGKTTCAELAILNFWRQNKERAIYIQSSRELIDIQLNIWKTKFKHIANGSKVINKLTGDGPNDFKVFSSSHLILATPEDFEFISRRWRKRKAIQSLGLIIADDCHDIGDGTEKGILYETLLTRMKILSSLVQGNLRFVILSHPLANGRDFGEWLGCAKNSIFNFDPKLRFRPIQEMVLRSVTADSSGSVLSSSLTAVYDHIRDLPSGSKIVMFASNRMECIKVGIAISDRLLSDGVTLLNIKEDQLEPYLDKVQDELVRESLKRGIGIYYTGMHRNDYLIISRLFKVNSISILVSTKDASKYCPSANNVIILGAQEFDFFEHKYVDFSVMDILEMIGCCVDDLGSKTKVLFCVKQSKLHYFKKFLNEALPLESFLESSMSNIFVNEIGAQNISNRQECLDWITFSYYYRRLLQNPSFYDLKDTSHIGISTYLSDLVENTLANLEKDNFVELQAGDEDDEETAEEIVPLNHTMICSFYNVSYNTIKNISHLDSKARLRKILETVILADEFTNIQMRENEDKILSKINSKVPFKISKTDFSSVHVKVFLLIQAHFSRINLTGELKKDLEFILKNILKVLYASVDALSSEGYLSSIHCIDLCQMIVQGMWSQDSPLKQIPYFDHEILERCKKAEVETVYDIMALEDDERDDILRLEGSKLDSVADFVNHYPNVDISYEMDDESSISVNQTTTIKVKLERDEEIDDPTIVSEKYPFPKSEVWWVVLGDSTTRYLYAISKTTITKELQEVELEFSIPHPGDHHLTIWCMCDSYIDADKEISIDLTVKED